MNRPKILIVDDEPFNVDYLEQELEGLDYDTSSAINGQEALEKVSFDSPDLILLDIMMPVLDGFEVLARLKADVNTRELPVIVISASNDLKSIVRGIKLGAEDYLPKPFEPALLKARISTCLEKKRLRDLEQLYIKSLKREMEIGHEIQQGFLPSNLPKVDGWGIATYFKAAREVAGDFYDVFLLPDGNILFVIGDVCDKGVGAALFMTLFRSLIRATATSDLFNTSPNTNLSDPASRLMHIITFTNHYITDTHADSNMFATIFIGILTLHTGVLTYMNCGHDPPFWVSGDGAINTLSRTGPAVGIIPEASYTVEERAFKKHDLLLVFTDGVPDALGISQESYGKERLLEILKDKSLNSDLLIQKVTQDLNQFIGEGSQFDDITLLAIKREE